MKKRDKIFYPESQITYGFYTSGSEFADEHNIEYIGQYHKYNNGAIYSEYKYVKNKSKPLKTLIKKNVKSYIYSDLTENKYNIEDNIEINTFVNKYYIPTNEDIDNRYYIRYFLKRKNSKEFK